MKVETQERGNMQERMSVVKERDALKETEKEEKGLSKRRGWFEEVWQNG